MRVIDFKIPKSLTFDTDPAGTNLDLVFETGANVAAGFSPQLSVHRLSLSRIDEFNTPAGTLVQAVSTILSGMVYFESLDGAKYPLRPQELLRFEDVQGTIRTLQLVDGRINLNFRGRMRGMSTGWGEHPRDLMPTYLEWLQARHGLSLLWGSTLYVFGMLAALRGGGDLHHETTIGVREAFTRLARGWRAIRRGRPLF
jgi:hypothetical protein